jgi:hypothetical protein
LLKGTTDDGAETATGTNSTNSTLVRQLWVKTAPISNLIGIHFLWDGPHSMEKNVFRKCIESR